LNASAWTQTMRGGDVAADAQGLRQPHFGETLMVTAKRQ
jgi:hypothetical protein